MNSTVFLLIISAIGIFGLVDDDITGVKLETIDTIDDVDVVNKDLEELGLSNEIQTSFGSDELIVERQLLRRCGPWSPCSDGKQYKVCLDCFGNKVVIWRSCHCEKWTPWTSCRKGLTFRFCYTTKEIQIRKCPYQCTACCPTLYQSCPWWFHGQTIQLNECCRENACPNNQMCNTFVCYRGKWYCKMMCGTD